MPGVSSSEVARTVTRVFSEPKYQDSTRDSLLGKITHWFFDVVTGVWDAVGRIPGAAAVLTITFYALIALAVVAVVSPMVRRYWPLRSRGETLVNSIDRDAWSDAEGAARSEDYIAAAHWLYVAFVRSLVIRAGVRFHSSKTAGDYLRELRRKNQIQLFDQFKAFVHAYEIVVYRDEICDAPGYARLRALAEPASHAYRTAA